MDPTVCPTTTTTTTKLWVSPSNVSWLITELGEVNRRVLKNHFCAIANSVGSTDNRDHQVMNALRTVPGHNDVINVHELRQIVKGLKNNKAVGNDGIPSEVYKFASEWLLTIMSIFLSGCVLTGKLPNSLIQVVIILLLKCKSKGQQLQANCKCHSSLQGTWASLAVVTRQVRVDCRQPIWFLASTWDRNGHFGIKANSRFLP